MRIFTYHNFAKTHERDLKDMNFEKPIKLINHRYTDLALK